MDHQTDIASFVTLILNAASRVVDNDQPSIIKAVNVYKGCQIKKTRYILPDQDGSGSSQDKEPKNPGEK